MNTEEKIKQKEIELSAFLENFNAMAKMLNSHKEESVRKYEDEIASLSKQEESRPLTFLQLAEKYRPSLALRLKSIIESRNSHVGNLPLHFAEYINNCCFMGIDQARKFVAEIYLTLLAKEVNGNWQPDIRKEELIYTPWDFSYKAIRTQICFNEKSHNLAFSYSDEAKNMFNWYFGREEAK